MKLGIVFGSVLLVCIGAVASARTFPPKKGKQSVPASIKACPVDMKEVQGNYCPNVEETCLRWVNPDGKTIDSPKNRCGEFLRPTRCLSNSKKPVDYCVDTYELPNIKGEKPASWLSWTDSKKICEGQGKRLCTQDEWTFACEGENMQPYPYGDGYHRDTTACNFDNPLGTIDVFQAKTHQSPMSITLDSKLKTSGSMPRCVSPFGIYDQIGNIDEFVVNRSGKPYKSGMMGGHIFGVRNRCRAMTDAHNEFFSWYESGSRCCSDLK